VSHAKFVIVDHELLLPTSANFPTARERRNIEFGLLIHDSALCESVEGAMSSKRGPLCFGGGIGYRNVTSASWERGAFEAGGNAPEPGSCPSSHRS
jgi:hypothetical protein